MTDAELQIIRSMKQAISTAELTTVEKLLHDYYDLFQLRDSHGRTKLDECVKSAVWQGSVELIEMLVRLGANINAPQSTQDQEGAISSAVLIGDKNVHMVRWLLDHGAIVGQILNGRECSLSFIGASGSGSIECVKLLLERGAPINGLTYRNLSALDEAEMSGHKEVADYLRSQGARHGWQILGQAPPKPPEFVEHLEKYLGKIGPLSLQQMIPSGMPIRIHRAQVKDEQFLITEGMAAQPMNVPAGAETSGLRYAEVMIRLPKKWKLTGKALDDPTKRWPIEWLFRVARWPHENKTWLGPVAVIANGEPPQPFAKNTKLCCMFAKPAGYDFATWTLPDGETGTIYQLYPIYAEEREVERTHGWEALLAAFEENEFPLYIDPDRPNVYREFIEEE